ncbi:hypothetical protein, partial [Streptomyces sp. NPDC005407]|uniref:hypothetical protein n=1 Tax=Streptomyces sp. NPDC005407 TaxID=3155340 RepID=UPI0033A3AA4C
EFHSWQEAFGSAWQIILACRVGLSVRAPHHSPPGPAVTGWLVTPRSAVVPANVIVALPLPTQRVAAETGDPPDGLPPAGAVRR